MSDRGYAKTPALGLNAQAQTCRTKQHTIMADGFIVAKMYRRYGINSYKTLPKDKFEGALGWLNDWLQTLVGDTPF